MNPYLIRRLIKPLVYWCLGPRGYLEVHARMKARDVRRGIGREAEWDVIPDLVMPGTQAIDVGANFGAYTVHLARLVAPGIVYAFEPIPFAFAVAARVIRNFGADNARLFNLGVGEADAEAEFLVPRQWFGGQTVPLAHIREHAADPVASGDADTVPCRIVRLDGFSEIRRPVSFVKIDIEGADMLALRGMSQLVARDRPAIMIEYNSAFWSRCRQTADDLRHFSVEHRYGIHRYAADSRELRPTEIDEVGNYILIPLESAATLAKASTT